MRARAAVLMLGLLSSCSHTTVFRLSRPGEEVARALCAEAGPPRELSARELECPVLHQLHFRVRFAGELVWVTAPAGMEAELAVRLTTLAHRHGLSVQVVEEH
ncbi:MAG: hypothetical protein ACOZQL_16065 [Myxococcota bacterium]